MPIGWGMMAQTMATPNSNSNDSTFFDFITRSNLYKACNRTLADCRSDEPELDEVLCVQLLGA